MHNLAELDICVENYGSFLENENLKLPKSVFLCKTLVVLKLSFPGHDLMEKLLLGCPALEDLAISGTVGEGYLNFNVSALELKKLRINLDTENDDSCLADYNDLNVLVRAPKLEYFGLEQNDFSNVF
ncbi:hypothetical protein ACLB2K_050876 [Fragaria x ananassa]